MSEKKFWGPFGPPNLPGPPPGRGVRRVLTTALHMVSYLWCNNGPIQMPEPDIGLHLIYAYTVARSDVIDFDAPFGFCTLKHADFKNGHEKILRQWEDPPIWAQTFAHN